MRFAASVFLILVLFGFVFSQSIDTLNSNIRTAVAERRYADAIADLRSLSQTNPDIFGWNNFDYLLGRMYEKTGNSSSAAAQFQAVVKRNSVLKPYALFHLASIARSSGNLVLERLYLEELAAFSPDSILAETARNRIARSLFASGDNERALRAFESLTGGSVPPKQGQSKGENAVTRENRLFLARCLMFGGNTSAARENFIGLIKSLANPAQPDDIALSAVRELDKIDQTAGENAPAMSDYDHLQRASIYQFNRDFLDARRHFASIINDYPTSGIVPDAMYQTGRGYTQETNFSEAIKWYERTIEQFPQHPSAKDSLLQAASAYARLGKSGEAVRRYKDYIAKYPDDEKIDRAYLNIIDVLRDNGEEIDAQKWAENVQEKFRGKVAEAQALFAEARIHLSRNNWSASIAELEKLLTLTNLGGAEVPGGTTRTEVIFLRGFALEQSQNFPAAVEVYLSIPDGRNEYYGWRATERLQGLSQNPQAHEALGEKLYSLVHPPVETKDEDANRRRMQAALRVEDVTVRETSLNSLRKIYEALPNYRNLPQFKNLESGRRDIRKTLEAHPQDPHKSISDEFIFLGLYDEAAPEYDRAFPSAAATPNDLAYTKAVMYKRGDKAFKAVAFAEPLWRSVPADYQIELMPRDMIELLYPAPYADAFGKYAAPRNVDSRFLLSLVRQESRYQPDVKSYAAARGLMQFISTTSDKIASGLGLANFDQDQLYDPSTAILFGSQYTADLFRLFPNQPEAVAASYNGGEDNMKRWMKRSHSDRPDRYVPEIAFSQSKDYVYRVMANYRIYKLFYNENLAAK